jgi:hypothetical protein
MPISGSYSAGDAITMADCYVEADLTPSSSSYAVVQSWTTDVAVSGEGIPTTSTKPFGNPPIVFTGTKDPAQVVLTIVYTEGSTDPYRNFRTLFESGNNNPCDVRWMPSGSGTGNLIFTTSGGKLTACPPPTGSGSADSANVVQITIDCDSIAMTVSGA